MREGWSRVKLSEVLTRREERVVVEDGGLYPGLGVLRDGQGLFAKEPFVGGETSYSHLTKVRTGQVVLRTITAWEAPIGVVSDEQDGGFVSPSVFPVFTADATRLDPRFMALVCQYPRFWAEMRVRTTGTVLRRQTLSAEALMSIAIDLPPLDEQRRIVDLIGSLDAAIAAADDAVAKAEQARRAILADLLFATNVASPSSGRQLNRQTWRLESLGDVAGVVRGLSWSKDEERAAPGAGLIPVLRIGNVQVDGIDASDTLYVPMPASRTASKVLIGQSTIVMVGSNGNPARVGNAHRATQEINGYGFASFLIGVTPFRHVDSRFVLCVLQSDRVQSEITAATSGSTGLKNISLSWLRSLVIPVPPIEDQRFIAEVAEDLDAEVNALRVAARATRGMRRSLLAELLSGKHEIPPSYDRLLDAA